MTKNISVKQLTIGGIIAALYVALTAIFAPLSFGPVQVRISEMLTLLPMVSPVSTIGLTLGCLISNILFSGSMLDIIFGTLATFVAAVLTYCLRKNKYLAAFPPVIINAVVVAFILNKTVAAPLFLTMLTVGVGQAISCYAIGIPFISLVKKYSNL